MNQKAKLQQAVEATIAAGYQLDREAFEFLDTISLTEDPAAYVQKALQKVNELEEKPFFIDKSMLQNLIKEKPEEAGTLIETSEKPQEKKQQEEELTALTSSPFHPYAKDVEAQINILEDPTGKLSSNGTMEEYLQYFQDRFKRMEKLLRQRMDVRAATPIIEALKSQPKTKLKLIGMVTEKREAKQQTLITIEDLQASATILIPTKAPEEVHRKAQTLLTDQVICVAATKTRGHIFLAEDIILPEVSQKPPHRATEPIYAILTSDIHAGSMKFNKDSFKRFVQWLNGKYGNEQMREIAGHVLEQPRLSPAPQGVGGLVLNWHCDARICIDATDRLIQDGVFKRGPFSFHITAGPDQRQFTDGLGVNLANNHAFAEVVHGLMRQGHEVGSHGGWIHDWFGLNVSEDNQASMETYLQKNADAIEALTGKPQTEYSAPTGNQPEWATRWLDEHNVKGYYFTGNIGSLGRRSKHFENFYFIGNIRKMLVRFYS